MSKLTTPQKVISFQTRGRFGRPGSFGRVLFGYNIIGLEDSLCGIYQKATFATGREISIRPFYFPTDTRSAPQLARRAIFQAGVSAYRALTPLELDAINRKGKARRMTGYNFFLSKYLRSH